ncbi:hypothetical protein I3760_10G056000 [Carya illinoinensis]|nr:hypothetical protein I3760_10G056000 [Carya illinoinensis]
MENYGVIVESITEKTNQNIQVLHSARLPSKPSPPKDQGDTFMWNKRADCELVTGSRRKNQERKCKNVNDLRLVLEVSCYLCLSCLIYVGDVTT